VEKIMHMPDNMTRAIGFTAILMLSACALSPQTVVISPQLGVGGSPAGAGKRLEVQVRDSRPNTVIGYRGGVYETAAIETAADLTQSLQSALVQAFIRSGYQIADSAAADIRLVIDIETLDYQARQNKIIWDIEFFASIQATASAGGREKSLQLQDRITRQFAKAPTVQENESLINDVLSKLLQRLIENGELLAL
jgi:uncharacterized lipoprotein YajG